MGGDLLIVRMVGLSVTMSIYIIFLLVRLDQLDQIHLFVFPFDLLERLCRRCCNLDTNTPKIHRNSVSMEVLHLLVLLMLLLVVLW